MGEWRVWQWFSAERSFPGSSTAVLCKSFSQKEKGPLRRWLFRRKSPGDESDRSVPVSVYWWRGVPNLGDSVSRVLVAGLSGRPVEPAEKRDRGKLIACGSTIHRARRGDRVWGTGTLHEEQIPASRAIEICAVRGPETAKILRNAGFECPDVFGDPALLLPEVCPRERPRAPRYRVGVVPHYQDKGRLSIEDPAVAILDIQGSLDAYLDLLLECERIVSSSLHGVIFAEAYGISAQELRLGDDVRGAAHKFTDYYRGTGRERPEPLKESNWSRERPWQPPRIDPELRRSFPVTPLPDRRLVSDTTS